MFVIQVHNEHAFDDDSIHGPYQTIEEAKAGLVRHVELVGDEDYVIGPNTNVEDGANDDGTYAGFDYERMMANHRDEDLVSEIWAMVMPLNKPL